MVQKPIPRRTVLRGLGAALGLPLLEAMFPRTSLGGLAEPVVPTRYAFVYTPNGYWQPTFVPQGVGKDWELTPTLEPLADVRQHVSVLTGLDRQFTPGTGVHAQAGACWLTSSPPDETLDGGFPTNITADQILARQIGRDTVLPSLELSCNDHTDQKETRYFESVSWYGPGYAATTEKNPRTVFRRLFGEPNGDPAVSSVLDAVLEDASDLRGRLGGVDRVKLDEFLESVRSTEKRIQRAEDLARRWKEPPMAEPAGIPRERGDYLRVMGQLIAMAFQLDVTRVATLVVDPERWDSPRMYHGVFDKPQNHHVLTHTKEEGARDKLALIDRFHVAQYAELVRLLASSQEGSQSLLDHSAVVMGSGMSDGNRHNYGDLNVLLAGSAGGKLKSGEHHHFDGDVPLGSLWLTLLKTAGVERQSFADSHGNLSSLMTSS